jgi:hypothetical protein
MSFRVAVAIVLTMVSLAPASAAIAGGETEATIRIVIGPINGDPGTEIAVTGEGAKPGIAVRVMLVANGDTGAGEVAGVDVTPAGDGKFLTSIIVPEGTPDGGYAVRAEQRNQGGGLIHYYWVGFQVGGGNALLPVTGTLPGTSVTVTAALAALLVVALAVQGTRRVLRR